MKILVVAAHPDDEVLGCGGTIAQHADRGDEVHLLFMSDGVGARQEHAEHEPQQRRNSAEKAASILGAQRPAFHTLPDNQLDTVPLLEIVRLVEVAIAHIEPVIVYTHQPCDLNIDHVLTCQAVVTACRPKPGHPVKSIYGFEVPSSTQWAFGVRGETATALNHFVDVSEVFERKMKALEQYEAEMCDFPHPRSAKAVEALACLRGVSVGVRQAEAFGVIRQVL